MKIKYTGEKTISRWKDGKLEKIKTDDVFDIKDSELKNYVNREDYSIFKEDSNKKNKNKGEE